MTPRAQAGRAAATALALLVSAGMTAATTTATRDALAGINDLQGTKPGDLPGGGKFLNADGCALCHGGGFMGDTKYLPFDTWAGTMMANAARDPVFFAALAVANQDAPGVGTFCIRCHTPIGFVRGHATPPDASALDDVDRQGIGCEVCHRAAPSLSPNDPYFLGNAQLVFTNDPAKRGPYADSTSPSHTTIQDVELSDPRFCGQCHQVTNPERHLKDESGVDLGVEFPLDTTFEEWASSAHSKPGPSYASCVDCHMPKRQGSLPVATPQDAKLRQDPREHGFTGGNLWGIQAVMKADPARAATYAYAFEGAMERTKATLGAAVKVSIVKSSDVVLQGDSIEVTARVENVTGHKFPTGYAESRRAWLAISLIDSAGTERSLLGGYDEASGSIAPEPKTRVYRAQHGRFTGASSEAEDHLVMHDRILSDTRIPPAGFSASITTVPIGEIDYKDGSGGYKNYDEAAFTLAPPAGADGPFTLSVRVYYQSMTREYVEALRDANTTNSAGEELHAIYEATDRAPPILIASADASIHIGFAGGAGGGGGAGGFGESGGGAGAAGSGGGVTNGGAGTGGSTSRGCDCTTAKGRRTGGADPGSAGAAAMFVGALCAALLRSSQRTSARCYWDRKPSAGRRRAA